MLNSSIPTTKHGRFVPILFFNKLSLVKITPLLKNHKKKISGICKRQICWDTLKPILTRCLYMEFTVNSPLLLRSQKNLSHPTYKLMLATFATKLFHSTSLIPTKAFLKEIFRGIALEYLLQ